MSSQANPNDPVTPPTTTTSALTSAARGSGSSATANPINTTPWTMNAPYALRPTAGPAPMSPGSSGEQTFGPVSRPPTPRRP
jgi:hypothetical protein